MADKNVRIRVASPMFFEENSVNMQNKNVLKYQCAGSAAGIPIKTHIYTINNKTAEKKQIHLSKLKALHLMKGTALRSQHFLFYLHSKTEFNTGCQ
ncbi:Hypothetical predicted protein, partial [Paramuricea clavata]